MNTNEINENQVSSSSQKDAQQSNATTTQSVGITDEKFASVKKIYDVVKERFDHTQVGVLSTLLYRLDQDYATSEIIERERVKVESYNHRTAWATKKGGR